MLEMDESCKGDMSGGKQTRQTTYPAVAERADSFPACGQTLTAECRPCRDRSETGLREWRLPPASLTGRIHRALCALFQTAPRDDPSRIHGRESWVCERRCQRQVERAARLRQLNLWWSRTECGLTLARQCGAKERKTRRFGWSVWKFAKWVELNDIKNWEGHLEFHCSIVIIYFFHFEKRRIKVEKGLSCIPHSYLLFFSPTSLLYSPQKVDMEYFFFKPLREKHWKIRMKSRRWRWFDFDFDFDLGLGLDFSWLTWPNAQAMQWRRQSCRRWLHSGLPKSRVVSRDSLSAAHRQCDWRRTLAPEIERWINSSRDVMENRCMPMRTYLSYEGEE